MFSFNERVFIGFHLLRFLSYRECKNAETYHYNQFF
jgi:hypothetical protein